MTEPLVLFMPSGRRGRFPRGTNLLDAARSLGVYVESVCGGRGMCGRCQVVPVEGIFAKHGITCVAGHLSESDEAEQPYRARGALAADRRLACTAKIVGDLVVDVPPEFATNRQVVRKRAETRAIAPDPATRLFTVAVPEPDLARPLGDTDRLLAAVEQASGLRSVTCDPAVLPRVQGALRQGGWRVTAAVHQDLAGPLLTAVWPADLGWSRCFGVALDIGSTTIAGQLVDLATGRAVASAGTVNPQVRFGEDLMSRVSYAMLHAGGAETLGRVVREAVAALVARLCGQAGVREQTVLEAAIVGNPVMHHLLLGIDPAELGQAPFALAVSGALRLPARELGGLGLAPGAQVYVLPCIAGHVGADAAAVALADGPQHHDETTLVVDVGTNAELLLGNRHRVLAASSPTGPAFEGAQISGGQRAAPGAIERVRIDPASLDVRLKILGVDPWSDEPGFLEAVAATGITGICGSGVIEAIAEMFLAGVVGSDGLIRARDHPRVLAQGRTHAFLLWDGALGNGALSDGVGVRVQVTQADVRAVQLAKGALYAGARLLMDTLGVDRVERIKLAGAFGSYIDPQHAMVLGMIPDCPLDRVSGIGNAAGTGARMALASRLHRAEVERLVRGVEKIETAMEPRFQEHFVQAMAFPNARDPFPQLRRAVALPEPAPPRARRSRAPGNAYQV